MGRPITSPSIDPSMNEWVPAKIAGHCKVYVSPLLMLNTCHSPWHRPRCCAWGLAGSISEPVVCGFFQCQNGPQEDHYDDGLLALSEWPQAQKIGPGVEAPHQLSCSLFSLVTSILKPRNFSPTVSAARASCYQYWPNKVPHWWAWFGASFRTGGAIGENEFRR